MLKNNNVNLSQNISVIASFSILCFSPCAADPNVMSLAKCDYFSGFYGHMHLTCIQQFCTVAIVHFSHLNFAIYSISGIGNTKLTTPSFLVKPIHLTQRTVCNEKQAC